jgi:hypothetical protein
MYADNESTNARDQGEHFSAELRKIARARESGELYRQLFAVRA